MIYESLENLSRAVLSNDLEKKKKRETKLYTNTHAYVTDEVCICEQVWLNNFKRNLSTISGSLFIFSYSSLIEIIIQ